MLALAVSLLGCDYVGGRTIKVDFSSADGLDEGSPVYFAGVEIGRTGQPQIVDGKARVPVELARRHREAVPPNSVFVIEGDPRRENAARVVGYDLGIEIPDSPAAGGVYPGFSSELEVALLLGADRARKLWRQIESAR